MNPSDEISQIRASIRELHINIESLHSTMHDMFESQNHQDAQIATLTSNTDKLVTTMTTLALVTKEHRNRIEDLEGGLPPS
jgi:chromosome segregation ATPase